MPVTGVPPLYYPDISSTPLYLAIDPGETTGFVVARLDPRATKSAPLDLPDSPVGLVAYGTWQGIREFVTPQIQSLFSPTQHPLTLPPPAIIILEDYVIYPYKAQSHSLSRVFTAKVIGRVELIAHVQHIPIHYQMASEAKKQWPNKRLHRYYSKSTRRRLGTHAIDALRHLLTYVENHTKAGPILDLTRAI